MFRTLLPCLSLSLTLGLGACGGGSAPGAQDLAGPPAPDQASAPADMAGPPDLSAGGDLSVSPDMQLTLMDPPNCVSRYVTAQTLYDDAAKLRCTARYCHGTLDPVMNFSFDSAAGMRMAWLGRTARQAPLPFVTEGNLDRSYVMWKLTGQHERIAYMGMSGDRMPPTGPLDETALCLFVNWIRGGARP